MTSIIGKLPKKVIIKPLKSHKTTISTGEKTVNINNVYGGGKLKGSKVSKIKQPKFNIKVNL